jgi:hypothetical protein
VHPHVRENEGVAMIPYATTIAPSRCAIKNFLASKARRYALIQFTCRDVGIRQQDDSCVLLGFAE